MATFSVGGLSSGIDYNSMIEQIMKLERQPITRLESKKADYNKKISVYGELSSKLAALKTAANALRTASSFYAKNASSSDDAVFTSTAASSAAVGNYSISVTTLAQAHRIASSPVAAETTVVSSATGNFSFTVGGGAATTVVVSTETTLENLRDAINAEDGDAEASIIYDGSGYRLVLTSKESGASNGIVVTENVSTLGLPSGPVSGGTTLQAAQDAAFSIDTFSMTRSSNTVEDAIAGVTISLKKGGTATLSVTNDTDVIREKIDALVAAYNDVVSLVSTNAYYDTNTRKGGSLTGESTARDIVTGLQRIVGTRVSGLPEGLRVLAQIGIETGTDGKLTVDSTVLNDKLTTELAGVSDLFNADGGLAAEIYDYADEVTDTITGSITYRTKGLGTLVTGISDDILEIEARLTKEEEELRARFARLEALLSTLTSQTAFLSSLSVE
ncbi:MAG: flagellar filament capping protein FliD [Deltaproteobacteria bacterium]|nr:flagellar filament capping protein FliD [Deltaproteobacteria bacterium]